MLQTCARGRSTPQPSCEETSMSDAARSRQPVVGIVMGSDSDWPVMEAASKALTELEVEHEVDVVSAHRMPREMIDYGGSAAPRGGRVIIARAGGAPPPPGMLASVAPPPRLGGAGPPPAPPRRGTALSAARGARG